MAVLQEIIVPEELLIQPLVEQLTGILEMWERHYGDNPPLKGYEDKLRNYIFEHCDYPGLGNGSRVNWNHDTRHEIDDMYTYTEELINHNDLTKNRNGNQVKLQSEIEWGHDQLGSIKGCVNKPVKDFIKWRRLSPPYNEYNRIPLSCFQIITDKHGNDADSVIQIENVYLHYGTLKRKWIMNYDNHEAIVYLFLNVFDNQIEIHDFLNNFLDQEALTDLGENLYERYETNKNWPLGNYLNEIVNID